MKESINNPSTNKLASGINLSDLIKAVDHSGYPLQTIIGNNLREDFMIQDEWSYLDKDTNELRTIDILAKKYLFEFGDKQPLVRPTLSLLIECKQSDLPYIFFLSPLKPRLFNFPIIAGLANNKLEFVTDDSPSTWTFSILHTLGLDEHQFLKHPDYCYTLSKTIRKGKNLELSGSETYNSLILPIIKSILHFQNLEQPPSTAVYFDCYLTVGIGVVNAPMVGVQVSEDGKQMTLLPWVRTIRREYFEEADKWEKEKIMVVDVVHKDFFQNYISDHLLPFANDFSKLALKHQKILASGKGFIPGMNKDSWDNLESRLQIRNAKSSRTRTKIRLQNIFRLLVGKTPIE